VDLSFFLGEGLVGGEKFSEGEFFTSELTLRIGEHLNYNVNE
jgi:hypothetical protein